MKYLCLGYHEERIFDELSPSEGQAFGEECAAYEESLRSGGHFVEGIALERAANAATLRFERGRATITDGPFAETKEQLGGVMVLEANDLNHAIQLVSQMPCMRFGGSLEIRPINEALCSTADSAAIGTSIDKSLAFATKGN